MCSRGTPFLCCGKSKRHRCVPLTSFVQSSVAVPCASTARVPANGRATAAVPSIRPKKLRRSVRSVDVIRNSFEFRGRRCDPLMYTSTARHARASSEFVDDSDPFIVQYPRSRKIFPVHCPDEAARKCPSVSGSSTLRAWNKVTPNGDSLAVHHVHDLVPCRLHRVARLAWRMAGLGCCRHQHRKGADARDRTSAVDAP